MADQINKYSILQPIYFAYCLDVYSQRSCFLNIALIDYLTICYIDVIYVCVNTHLDSYLRSCILYDNEVMLFLRLLRTFTLTLSEE